MITLEADRLILRTWSPDDLDDLFEYAQDPAIGPSAGWAPHVNREFSARILESFRQSDEVWAVEYKPERKVIGSVGLHGDRKREGINARMLGYVLARPYWGKGLMTEAARRVIRHAFEDLAVDVLSVYHYPHNDRSRRVIEKCGFRLEGTMRRASKLYDGTVMDEVCYSIIKEEYFADLAGVFAREEGRQ